MTERSIPRHDYEQIIAKQMTERALQTQIIGTAQRLGWLVYHTHDSRRSQPGYPDLHLVHPTHRISALVELKTQKGRLSPQQKTWLIALALAGVTVALWRPIDMTTGRITDWLTNPHTTIPGE